MPSGAGAAAAGFGLDIGLGFATNFVRQPARAEIVGRALVLGLMLRGRFVDAHAADRIDRGSLQLRSRDVVAVAVPCVRLRMVDGHRSLLLWVTV